MSVIVTAVFRPVDGRAADLISALQGAIPAVHAENGCLKYAIHDASDGTVTMIEKWSTPEELAAHMKGDAIRGIQAAVGQLLAAPPVVTTMTPLPAGRPEQGAL